MRSLRVLISTIVIGLGLLVSGPAIAMASSSGLCGDVGCTAPAVSAQPRTAPAVQATSSTTTTTTTTTVPAASGGLAFTGADIAETTVIAIVFLGLGAALLYSSRRSRNNRSLPLR